MCGIAGVFDFHLKNRIDKINIDDFFKEISHRGVDGRGKYLGTNIVLLHSRLSIIDLSESGAQPFYGRDNSIVCIANGEIYNFVSLKKMLGDKGYVFKGTSDCEILPFMYEEYGVKMVEKIKGMFAFVIWDAKYNKLVLFRDRFGIKPLYYHFSNDGKFYFGSELKSILFHKDIELKVDLQAIHDYLSLCYIPEPGTGFQNIFALEPANYLEVCPEKSVKACYWDIDSIKNNYSDSYDSAKIKVNELLLKSVEGQLISDAPLGAFLSGGIDSSTIISKIHEIRKGKKFDTFTVKFPDKDFDESSYARLIAERFNTNHHLFEIKEGKGDIDLIKKLLNHFDQPFGDSSCIPTYLISEVVKHNVKVSVSGDGGDEIFAGYLLFSYFKFIKKIKLLPDVLISQIKFLLKIVKPVSANSYRKVVKLLDLSRLKDYEILTALKSYLTEEDKNLIYSDSFKTKLRQQHVIATTDYFRKIWKTNDDDSLNISKLLFKSSLPSDMLKKVDMMSMLAGIEVRVPFLDEDLVNYSLSLPESYKLKGKNGKLIIKDLLLSVLPKKIVYKKKTGFAIPLDTLVNVEFEVFINEELLSPGSFINSLFNEEILRNWIDIFLGKKKSDKKISREGIYQRIFMLLSLSLWYKKYQPAI